MRTSILISLFFISSSLAMILSQNKHPQQIGAVYAFSAKLKNNQIVKIVMTEILDDGYGFDGYKIDFKPGVGWKLPATETPQDYADLIRENYDLELSADLFETVAEIFSSDEAHEVTIDYVKTMEGEAERGHHLTYRTGNPSDHVGIPKKKTKPLPQALPERPPKLGPVNLSLWELNGKKWYISVESSYFEDDNSKGWDFVFKLGGTRNPDIKITAEQLAGYIKEQIKDDIDPLNLKDVARSLNKPDTTKALFSTRLSKQIEKAKPKEVFVMPDREAYYHEEPVMEAHSFKLVGAVESEQEVGRQEFKEADKMSVCLEPMDKEGIFNYEAIESHLGLLHRNVDSWSSFNDGKVTACFVEFGFERPDFCAILGTVKDGKGTFRLRGDSSASCTKYLNMDKITKEPTPINPVYILSHVAGEEDFIGVHQAIASPFITQLVEGKVFTSLFDVKLGSFKWFSVKYGYSQEYSAGFMAGQKECNLVQTEDSPYMVKYVLTSDSPAECQKYVNSQDNQKAVFKHKKGDWQRELEFQLTDFLAVFNGNNFFAAGVSFKASDLVSLKESINEDNTLYTVNTVKNGVACEWGIVHYHKNDKKVFNLHNNSMKCNELIRKNRVL